MRYVVIDGRRDGIGDLFNLEFESLDEALTVADRQWCCLTSTERDQRTVYVLRSVNPDEDAEDHFDGDVMWADDNWVYKDQLPQEIMIEKRDGEWVKYHKDYFHRNGGAYYHSDDRNDWLTGSCVSLYEDGHLTYLWNGVENNWDVKWRVL